MNTPWKIVEMAIPRGYRAIVDSEGHTICNPSPMGEANARLIAAAPDLLAALRLATHALAFHAKEHGVAMDEKSIADAYAAIDKATEV